MAPNPTVLQEMSELRGCPRDCPLPVPLLVPPLHGPAAWLLQHPCAGTSPGIQQELGAAGALQFLVSRSSAGAKRLMLWSSIQGTATVNNCQLKLVHREKSSSRNPPCILAHDSHASPAPLRKEHGWKVQTWDSPGWNCERGPDCTVFNHITEPLPSYPFSPHATDLPRQLEGPWS